MTVRALRRGTMAGRGASAPSTPITYTLYGVEADGYVYGATTGAATGVDTASGDIYVGQVAASTAYQGFIAFDTSAALGTITAVTLSLYGVANATPTEFSIDARLHDWGSTLETADWVTYTSITSKTLLAQFPTGSFNASGYNTFTSQAAFLTSINQAGFTRILLVSSRQSDGTNPPGDEYVGVGSGNRSGTSQDPKLVIDALI